MIESVICSHENQRKPVNNLNRTGIMFVITHYKGNYSTLQQGKIASEAQPKGLVPVTGS